MGTIIIRNAVQRKVGYLYYVDGQGNVCEAEMARGGKSKIAKRGRPVEQSQPKKKSLFD